MKVDLFGEKSLTIEEAQRFEKILEKEIDEKNPALGYWDELILKQKQARK